MYRFDLKNTLVYNDQVVGYRVDWTYRNGSSINDVSLKDFQLINEDFKFGYPGGILEHYPPIRLVEKGDLLVSEDGADVKELTYGTYASIRGRPKMKETDVDLKLLYNKYNREIFGGRLPTFVPVYWTNRMTASAGICRYSWRKVNGEKQFFDFRIGLSIPYHEKFPHETVETLVHEMIHVLHPGKSHGREFQNEMHRIRREFGINVTIRSTERATYKYIYECASCGYEYKRSRRINLATAVCGVRDCGGELYLVEDLTDDDDPFDGSWASF